MENKNIIDYLNCPICFNLCEDPLDCTKCGNIFCEDCIKVSKCPICRQETNFKESKFATKLIDTLETKCEYCNINTTKQKLKPHRFECIKTPIMCKEPDCDFIGVKSELNKHIKDNHVCLLSDKNELDGDLNMGIILDFKENMFYNEIINNNKFVIKESKGIKRLF